MTVQHKGTAIAIWVICAVLLVAVIALAIYLLCYRRRQRELRKLRRQLLLQTEDEHNTTNTTEWDVGGAATAANTAPLRGRAQGTALPTLYPGFHRRTTEELEALPSPSGVSSFPAPLVVYLHVRQDQACMERCDILLTVDRLGDSLATDRCGYQLLGNDGYYNEDFLLYTTPLEFREPGTYVIQAFTVHPSKQIVGAVHQFMYVVTRAGEGNAVAALQYGGHGGNYRHDNMIDIDIARRLAERQQLQAAPQSDAALHYNPSVQGSEPAFPSVPPSAVQFTEPPLPPVIMPGGGEVTTSTDIVITPNALSTTPDQLRYSVDGSYPNLLYNGPFTLSLPPPSLLPSQRRRVVIQAVAVRAGSAVHDALQPPPPSLSAAAAAACCVSSITRVVVQVRPGGVSYFDADVPTPSIRLRASEATLYFDESQNPPHTQTVYELVYVNEARRKIRYSRRRAQVYTGEAIAIPENVATVHAWTVMQDPSTATAAAAGTGSANVGMRELVRSVPTIYDCSRAATEHGKLSRRRVEQYHLQPGQLLPPPVMCVSCGDVELMFDDPPANGRIAYTLNDTEPALCDVYPPACAVPLQESGVQEPAAPRCKDTAQASPVEGDRGGAHTFIYQPGKRIYVTQLETKQVYVTARVFVPIFEGSDGALYGSSGGQGGSCPGSGKLLGYRFGGVFHRGFYFNNQK